MITHKISKETELTFSREDYSKFKYGDRAVAWKMAAEIEIKLAKKLRPLIGKHKGKEFKVGVFGAPFNKLPTASNTLAYNVANLLDSDFRAIKIDNLKISRQHSYEQDYSQMSEEDRDKSLTAETYHFNDHIEELNQYDLLIFLDDIKITGSHERRIKNLIEVSGITTKMEFVYYAHLVPGCCEPAIEHRLNQANFISEAYFTAWFIVQIKAKNIVYNTRLVKRILSLDAKYFAEINRNLSLKQRNKLIRVSETNSYQEHEYYKNNYLTLTNKMMPSKESPSKLSLVKRTEMVYDLTKKLDLDKQPSTNVILVLDVSPSMQSLYEAGEIQTLVDRVLPIAITLDTTRKVEVIALNHQAEVLKDIITQDNYLDFVKKSVPRLSGGTDYAPSLELVEKLHGDKYSEQATIITSSSEELPDTRSWFTKLVDCVLGRKYVPKMKWTNTVDHSVSPSPPSYVLFFTDGDTWSKEKVTRKIKEMSAKSIFIQFIGIGFPDDFHFLQKLDKMGGRKIDNVNFFSLTGVELKTISDQDLYSKLLAEYPSWLKEAKEKNIVS